MKTILKNIRSENSRHEKQTLDASQTVMNETRNSGGTRRELLKRSALGGIALSSIMGVSVEETIAHTTSKVNRLSNPSELKITDLRYVTIDNGTSYTNARNVIIRIDTNQGIYGLGELRDGADPRYGLFLKSRILGMNPCNVEMIFKKIMQIY